MIKFGPMVFYLFGRPVSVIEPCLFKIIGSLPTCTWAQKLKLNNLKNDTVLKSNNCDVTGSQQHGFKKATVHMFTWMYRPEHQLNN